MRRALSRVSLVFLQFRFWLGSAVAVCSLPGQITTGIVEESGHRPHAEVRVRRLPNGPSLAVKTDDQGRFTLVLPYGDYRIEIAGENARRQFHLGAGSTRQQRFDFRSSSTYFGSYSVAGSLLNREPTAVTQPLDFAGPASTRLVLLSQQAFSWTGTRYELQGMNATDAYQPGFPVLLPDVSAIDEVTVESGPDTVRAYGTEIGILLREGFDDGSAWHGQLSSVDTGGVLASDNLPGIATRNALQQSERYNWYTRDGAQAGGTIGRHADLFMSGTAQWASQTVPIAPRGQDQNSRLLFGNAVGRVQLTPDDQVDALYSGSQIHLSDWGRPAGLEASLARRMAPSYGYNDTYGFSGLAEADHLDFLQVGWTRQLTGSSGAGALQVRYGFSTGHLDTFGLNAGGQSTTDVLTGVVSGAAPVANLGVRTRQELEGAWLPDGWQWDRRRHRLVIGGGWEGSKARNRFSVPDGLNLITADGRPDSVVEFDGGIDGHEHVRQGSVYVRDQVQWTGWLTFDLGVLGDFARGSVPRRGQLISWNSASPHVAVAIAIPQLHGLMLRGGYSRRYAPLAGQFLDFGDPESLSGQEYQWMDANGDRQFEPGEQGMLLRRFGGAYSSVAPSLRRPYADEFDVSAEARLPRRIAASVQLYRRDEKDRIAAVNVGIPVSSFSPRVIADPGPDGVSGTFDDGSVTVFQQNAATLGQDRFLLTNPAGLREEYEGFTAQVMMARKYTDVKASFTTERSWGPTNPGTGVLANDPGIVGALYMDPNTLVNAAGHDYFDRGFLGKVEMTSRLPRMLGSVELDNVVDYLDGLVFARQLLVNGLTQGPLAVAATVRGSPDGGNRAEYVLNWNLRLSRVFRWADVASLRVSVDVLNVANMGNRIQESDVSGVRFNKRLPVAIQAPRFVRFGVGVEF